MNTLSCPRCLTANEFAAQRCVICGAACAPVPAPVSASPPSPGATGGWALGVAASLAVAALPEEPDESGHHRARDAAALVESAIPGRQAAAAEHAPQPPEPAVRPLPPPDELLTSVPPHWVIQRPDPSPAATARPAPTRTGWAIRESPRQAALRERAGHDGAPAPSGTPTAVPAPAAAEPATPAPTSSGAPPMGDSVAFGTAASPLPLAPAPWERSRRGTARRSVGTLSVALGLRLAVALVGGLVIYGGTGHHTWVSDLIHGGHGIQVPAAIAGYPRVGSDQSTTSSDRSLQSAARAQTGVQDALAATYGDPAAQHTLSLLVVRGNHDSIDTAQLTDALASAGAALVTQGAVLRQSIDGVDYACFTADVTGTTFVSQVCTWDDYDVVGVVVAASTTSLTDALGLARQARDATER